MVHFHFCPQGSLRSRVYSVALQGNPGTPPSLVGPKIRSLGNFWELWVVGTHGNINDITADIVEDRYRRKWVVESRVDSKIIALAGIFRCAKL